MNAAMTALRDKLATDLQTCEGLIYSIRSKTMETYEVDGQGIRTYTTRRRLSDHERMAENLRETIALVDALVKLPI